MEKPSIQSTRTYSNVDIDNNKSCGLSQSNAWNDDEVEMYSGTSNDYRRHFIRTDEVNYYISRGFKLTIEEL